MAKFIPTTRFNPCPLCSDTSGDCRIVDDTILCHDYIDQDSPVRGYKYLKPSSNGIWGIHVVDNGKQFDREQWERDKAQRDKKREQQLEEIKAKALPIKERDKGYRKIAHYLGLASNHRQDLLRRGLNSEQIASYPFFSADNYNRIPSDIPKNLPGVGIDRYNGDNCLIIRESGYFCPSFDINGQVNGGQIRYETENNKYRWPKGIVSSHLPNGELPVTFLKGKNDINILNLVEGILKPLIVGEKLGLEICGAAGGNFTASPEQFKEILTHNDYEKIVLHPDGGDILNPNVMKRWHRVIKFIEKSGYGDKLFIGWRGQVNKEDGDLDEISLEQFLKIELITPKEFLDKSEFTRQFYQPLELSDYDDNLVGEQLQLRDEQAHTLADKGIDNRLNQLTKEPDLLVNQESLEGILEQIPNDVSKVFIKSAKCTRKSSGFIKPLIEEWEGLVVSITPRILLYKEQESSWGIQGIEKLKHNLFKEFNKTLGLCFDSFPKIEYKHFGRTLIILDEIRQGLKHLMTSSTLEEFRPYLLKILKDKLSEAVNNSGILVSADADLTDCEIDFIEDICPDGKSFLVINQWVHELGELYYNSGTRDATFKEILEDYKQEENLGIFCTSKKDAHAIHTMLKKSNPDDEIWLITGDTSEEKEIKQLIENNINQSIKDYQPRALIYTTSMSTGISIDGMINGEKDEEVYNHFTKRFVLAKPGILEPVEVSQAVARIRNHSPITIHTYKGKNSDKSLDWQEIRSEYKKKAKQIIDLTALTTYQLEEELGRTPTDLEVYQELVNRCDPNTEQIKDPYLDFASKIEARENYAERFFDLELFNQFKGEGYTLVLGEQCKQRGQASQSFRDSQKANKKEEIKAKLEAPEITIEEASEIQHRNATKEERYSAEKAFIRQELPGIELTESFLEKANRQWLNGHKNFFYYTYPNITQQLDQKRLINKLKQFTKGVVFLPDLKAISLVTETIKDIGLVEFLEENLEFSMRSPKLKEFIESCRFKRRDIKTNLGINLTNKTDPVQFIQRLGNKLGLKVKLVRTEKDGEEKIRYYGLDTEALEDRDRLAVLQALEKRFFADENFEKKSSETHTGVGLRSGTALVAQVYKIASAVLSAFDFKKLGQQMQCPIL